MSGSGSELSYARVTGFSNAEFMRGLLDKSRKCAGGKTNRPNFTVWFPTNSNATKRDRFEKLFETESRIPRNACFGEPANIMVSFLNSHFI